MSFKILWVNMTKAIRKRVLSQCMMLIYSIFNSEQGYVANKYYFVRIELVSITGELFKFRQMCILRKVERTLKIYT